MAVERTDVGDNAFSVEERKSVITLAFTVNVSLVTRANGLAEPSFFDKARFAEASIAVAVVVVSRRAVSADALDADVLRLADTSLGGD